MTKSRGGVVGRYAPSPTGSLHLGNLRTALAAYLSARAQRGKFLLRIEDIDRARSRPEWEPRHLADLAALGIEWDAPPVRQSERLPMYADAISKLGILGQTFECFCSRKDLREAASAPHEDENSEPPYPGTCRDLGRDELAARHEAGRQSCLRVRIAGSPSLIMDRFAGRTEIDLQSNGGDFVVRRADGEFAYQLACAVDDGEQGVTEVVRGADLLASGVRQAWLLELLVRPVPEYFHLPLMLGANGARLSKREGADDLAAYAAKGFDADAVRSYLGMTLGLCSVGERRSMGELIDAWEVAKIPRGPVPFDPSELAKFV
jgi:glutamyl-tRNA synthetase